MTVEKVAKVFAIMIDSRLFTDERIGLIEEKLSTQVSQSKIEVMMRKWKDEDMKEAVDIGING